MTPTPETLDRIIAGQRRAIETEPLLADEHRRVIAIVEDVKAKAFPERPRAEPRTFEAL